MPLLEVEGLMVARGAKTVLHGVSLAVSEGEITALLGANGAGKSSLALAIAGMLPIEAGNVRIEGTDMTGRSPAAIRAAGVAVVPEGHRVLRRLSVSDNLEVSGAHLDPAGVTAGRAAALAVFPELSERLDQPAGSMSGGQQQMLAIAQAIVAQPRLVVIDEMSLGLAPLIVKRLMGVVEALKAQGIGILLVEQFAHLALGIADRACVLDRGRVVFDGTAAEVQADASILHGAYMGT